MEFLEQYDPPGLRLAPTRGRPSRLLTVQVGAIAEDDLAIAILVTSPGSVSVAMPLVDQGFDGYARRVRTLSVAPYQLKARRTLTPDGSYVAYLPLRAIRPDPHGSLVLAYLTPPDLRLYRRLYVIPIPYFIEHCPQDKATSRSPAQYVFRGHLDGRRWDLWDQFLTEVTDLGKQWLDPVLAEIPPPYPTHRGEGGPGPLAVPPVAKPAFGGYGELWVAADLQRVGKERIVVARERVDIDAVDLLLHELTTHRFAGVQVKTATVESGRVQFDLSQDTFFVDPSLVLVVLPCSEDGRPRNTSFVFPSAAVPEMTSHGSYRGRPRYQGKIRVDRIAEKFRPYAVPTVGLGTAILQTAFK